MNRLLLSLPNPNRSFGFELFGKKIFFFWTFGSFLLPSSCCQRVWIFFSWVSFFDSIIKKMKKIKRRMNANLTVSRVFNCFFSTKSNHLLYEKNEKSRFCWRTRSVISTSWWMVRDKEIRMVVCWKGKVVSKHQVRILFHTFFWNNFIKTRLKHCVAVNAAHMMLNKRLVLFIDLFGGFAVRFHSSFCGEVSLAWVVRASMLVGAFQNISNVGKNDKNHFFFTLLIFDCAIASFFWEEANLHNSKCCKVWFLNWGGEVFFFKWLRVAFILVSINSETILSDDEIFFFVMRNCFFLSFFIYFYRHF